MPRTAASSGGGLPQAARDLAPLGVGTGEQFKLWEVEVVAVKFGGDGPVTSSREMPGQWQDKGTDVELADIVDATRGVGDV